MRFAHGQGLMTKGKEGKVHIQKGPLAEVCVISTRNRLKMRLRTLLLKMGVDGRQSAARKPQILGEEEEVLTKVTRKRAPQTDVKEKA